MGTRADFYVGHGADAEWIGSIGWDGYEAAEEPMHPIRLAKTEAEFRRAVNKMLSVRKDGTFPWQGWPWPWESSYLTDYVYWWDDAEKKARWAEFDKEGGWPDMTKSQNVTFGDRSGLVVVVK